MNYKFFNNKHDILVVLFIYKEKLEYMIEDLETSQ